MYNIILRLEEEFFRLIEQRAEQAGYKSTADYATHIVDLYISGLPMSDPDQPQHPPLIAYRESQDQPTPIQPLPIPTGKGKTGRKPRKD